MVKPNIILDLDQTLISAEPTEEYNFEKNKEKAKKFTFHNMDGYYVVFERPGLQEFLDFLFSECNVSVWTAASKDYAMFILEKILLTKPERSLDYAFCSYHCDISKKLQKGSKNLKLLKEHFKMEDYDLDKTFIVDDYDEVHKIQPSNAILAEPFEFSKTGSENDDFLVKVQKKLKEKIKKDTTDIQPIVTEINKELGVVKD